MKPCIHPSQLGVAKIFSNSPAVAEYFSRCEISWSAFSSDSQASLARSGKSVISRSVNTASERKWTWNGEEWVGVVVAVSEVWDCDCLWRMSMMTSAG